MRQLGGVVAGLLIGVALFGGTVEAADATAAESRNEIVVFGGASILDATRGQDTTIGIPGWAGDRWPGFPGVEVRTETSLGGSALFGARYSRYVKGRLAVEADLAVAPTHDVERGGELCLEGRCFGRGVGDRMGGPWGRGPRFEDVDFESLRTRSVTAWHYGGGLAYDITGGDVRPFVIFGAGGVSYTGARSPRPTSCCASGRGSRSCSAASAPGWTRWTTSCPTTSSAAGGAQV